MSGPPRITDWASAPRMNEIEALMWRSERPPAQSSTITAVMILDCTPDWERLVEAHRWATSAIPRSRQRVVEPLVPVGLPAWSVDEHFTLDHHLWRTGLPYGGSDGGGDGADLMSFAADFAMRPFDRTRPLWEAVLVDGLPGGRAAYVLKMHHSLTDGIGGIQLLSSVQSNTREHTPDKPMPANTVGGPSDRIRVTLDAATDGIGSSLGALTSAARVGLESLRNPLAATGRALDYAGSLRRVLTPPVEGSPLLSDRTGQRWRFLTLECRLAELRSAAKAAGGSVNDAFVASLLGGLRRYHDAHGLELEQIPMAMPISLRREGDPEGGNKFTAAMFAAPLAQADPIARIQAIGHTTRSLRTEAALDAFSALAPALNRLPSAVAVAAGRLGARADLSASNVRGQTEPSYLAGARVERMFPFGPLPGVAIMASMISHVGVCCLGINVDGDAVPDTELLSECLAAGLDEVLGSGRPSGEL